MSFIEEFSKKSNRELGEIASDFVKCGDCMNCKADGVLCGYDDPDRIRIEFMEVMAKRLLDKPDNL